MASDLPVKTVLAVRTHGTLPFNQYTLLCQIIPPSAPGGTEVLHGHALLLDSACYMNEIQYYHHGKQIGWQLTYRASCENYIHRIRHINSKDQVVIDKYNDNDFHDPKKLFPNESTIQAVTGDEELEVIYASKVDPSSFKNASEQLQEILKTNPFAFDPRNQCVFDLYGCCRMDLLQAWK